MPIALLARSSLWLRGLVLFDRLSDPVRDRLAGPGLPNAKQLKQIRLLAALTERLMPDTDGMSFESANQWLIAHFAMWMNGEEEG